MSKDIDTVQRELEKEQARRKMFEQRVYILTGANSVFRRENDEFRELVDGLRKEIVKSDEKITELNEQLESKDNTIKLLNLSVKENYKERNRLKQLFGEDILPSGLLDPISAYEMDELTFALNYVFDAIHYHDSDLYNDIMQAFMLYGKEAENRINERRLAAQKQLRKVSDSDGEQ